MEIKFTTVHNLVLYAMHHNNYGQIDRQHSSAVNVGMVVVVCIL